MATDLDLLRNKIRAIENQNEAFRKRLRAFNTVPLWKRLVMALRGVV